MPARGGVTFRFRNRGAEGSYQDNWIRNEIIGVAHLADGDLGFVMLLFRSEMLLGEIYEKNERRRELSM